MTEQTLRTAADVLRFLNKRSQELLILRLVLFLLHIFEAAMDNAAIEVLLTLDVHTEQLTICMVDSTMGVRNNFNGSFA